MITLMREAPGGDMSIPGEAGAPAYLILTGCGHTGHKLREALENEGVMAGVMTPEEIGDLPVQAEPDLLVLGSELGDEELLELVGELAQEGPPVLFLAPRSDPELALRVLEAGAADILPPPHSGQAILFRAAIVRNRRHGSRNGEGDLRFAGRVLDLEGRRLVDGARRVQLSTREFELLERLLEEDGQVVPRETLLKDIWGEDQDSEGVLEATVHRLRRKLEDDVSDPRHLTTVRGLGYRLEPAGQHPPKG